MKLVPSVLAAVLASTLPSFAAVNLAGKVVQLDSLPKQGVVVSLSGTILSDTTDTAGAWSLVEATTSLVQRSVPTMSVSNHLVLRNGRLQLALAGRDVFGRNLAASTANAPVGPFAWAGRSAATGGFDTLVYSWNGKTILRDTIAHDSLVRKGIVRHFDTTVNPAITHGYVSDDQNHFYRTVTLGKQLWMAENLNYKIDSSWCYNDSVALCPRYGRLYQWSALFGIAPLFKDSIRGKGDTLLQGICPQGWRIPIDSDVVVLLKEIDSIRSGTLLQSTSGWWGTVDGKEVHNGSDSLGFNLPASGYRNSNGNFGNLHTHAAFWTSTETNTPNQYRNASIGSFAWTAHFNGFDTSMARLDNFKDLGMSVRCIKGTGAPN
jgi:uncharacterized protein (TIGR02145 family)